MPKSDRDDLLSYQKLSWRLIKESFFQPLVYGPMAIGILSGFIGQLELALATFMATSISFAYYLLLGKTPRKRIQQQIEQALQQEEEQRLQVDQQRRRELYDRLDDWGKSYFTNLIKLEKVLQGKIKSLGDRLPNNQIATISTEVINEALRSIENRLTYKSLGQQFDPHKLQEDLETTKRKYDREKNYTLKREYRKTIQTLTDELNDLKKLRTAIQQLEQDIITSQSSLRSTILLLSQPQGVNASRLDSQATKLRNEVEIAKKVNEELAGLQIGSRLDA